MALAQVDPFGSNSKENSKGYVSYSPKKQPGMLEGSNYKLEQ